MTALSNHSPCRVPTIVLGVALLALAGCGGGGQYAVKGQFLYEDDNQPVTELAGETVTFDSPALGKSARGTIGADGTFRLGMLKEDDGVLPGKYKVSLTQPWPQPERPVHGKPVVDKMYENSEKTPLEAVVEEKSNEFTFKLKRLKKK